MLFTLFLKVSLYLMNWNNYMSNWISENFGGHNFKEGKSVGIHLEPGPDGGLVMIDDTTVLDRALKILDEIAGEAVEPVRA